jgi:hypothetical protein
MTVKTTQPDALPSKVPTGVTPAGALPPLTARPPQPARHDKGAVVPAHDEAHNLDEPGYGHGV